MAARLKFDDFAPTLGHFAPNGMLLYQGCTSCIVIDKACLFAIQPNNFSFLWIRMLATKVNMQ